MKIVIAGGTGFLGNELVHHFESDRNEVFVLTRGKSKIIGNIIKTLPDMRDVNFTFNGHYNSHKFLSDHLINLGYAPTDNTPFRSWFHRPHKDNWLEK